MAENKKERKNTGFIKVFGIILPSIPSLIFRLGKIFLSFKRQAKKGGKIFEKELRSQGLDKETAKKLTEAYMEPSRIRQYVTSVRQ